MEQILAGGSSSLRWEQQLTEGGGLAGRGPGRGRRRVPVQARRGPGRRPAARARGGVARAWQAAADRAVVEVHAAVEATRRQWRRLGGGGLERVR